MSLQYIRDTYGVPAKRGGRIKYTGNTNSTCFGTIKSARDGHLRVLLDDRVAGYIGRVSLHPTWKIEYLD